MDDLRLLKRGYPSWKAWHSMRNLLDASVAYQCVRDSGKRLATERRQQAEIVARVDERSSGMVGSSDGSGGGTTTQRQQQQKSQRRHSNESLAAGGTPAPSGKVHPVSLAKLTCYALGRPLDKAMQMSDWSVRPLSAAQLEYAALDARVLLSVAAVLDKQLSDGVAARNKLRTARARAHAAAVAAAAKAAEEAAAAAQAVAEARAAAEAEAEAKANAMEQDDDDGSDSSSLGSSVDSHGRRYSASSADSLGTTMTSATTDAMDEEGEEVEAQVEQEENGVGLPASAMTPAADASDREPMQMGSSAAGANIQEAPVCAAAEGKDRVQEYEAKTKRELMAMDFDLPMAPAAQTVELVRPGVHCYLPTGKDLA